MPEKTKFQRFIAEVGRAEVARGLGVTRPAVSSWAAGKSRPDPSRLEAILALAKTHGYKLTFVDVYPRTAGAE